MKKAISKILYAYRYGIVGGVSTQLLLRQRALHGIGVECELFFSQDNGLRQVLSQTNGIHFGVDISFKALVRKGLFDAVVVIDSPELLASASGTLWRRNAVFLDVHTTTRTGLSYLADVDVKRLNGVMVPTRYSAELVGKRLPSISSRIVPNILNTEIFSPQALSSHSETFYTREFVWVGKLDHHKNWRLALIYARLLKDFFGDVHLTLVGGYTAPDDTAEAFFKLAYQLDISDSISWLDRVGNTAIATIYRNCAATGGAMLVTSRDESFGMAAAEALLCGCPLISNDLPVFHEVFPSSPLVELVDIWQPDQVAEAIERVGRGFNDTERAKMHLQLQNRYGPEAFVEAFKKAMTV